MLLEALEETAGNQAEAARRLEMPRRTLVHKIKVLGLRREEHRGD
ncbi:MAG: helix-turn-helix domain-containing protein [Polyangiaceae bacterium]